MSGLEARMAWVDGEMRPLSSVTVPLLSQSLQRGTLVFDVYGVEWVDGAPHGLGAREHTERFLQSCELMGVPMPHSVDELLTAAKEVVHAGAGCDSVRLNAYWGEPSLDVVPVGERPVVAVTAYAFEDVHPSLHGGKPARLHLPGMRKIPSSIIPVQAKVAAAYAAVASAKVRARALGFHDVLLLDEKGELGESANMSFFVVADGALRTAGLDRVLDGITRRVVLDLADDEGIKVKVGHLPLKLLTEASEAFLTSTSKGVWPVASVGDIDLPAPVPGPISERLRERLDAVLAGTDPMAGRWLQPL